MMLASSKETEKLDTDGINRLERVGTLPTAWIPDGALRDRRQLFRTRLTLAEYWIRIEDTSHIFNK